MKTLIIVCGVSCSGKSTYCRELCKNLHNFKYISFDSITETIGLNSFSKVEEKRSKYNELNQLLIDTINSELHNESIDTVIVDHVMETVGSRYLILKCLDLSNVNLIIKFMSVQLNTLVYRAAVRSDGNEEVFIKLLGDLQRIYKNIELPNEEEFSKFPVNSVKVEIIDNN